MLSLPAYHRQVLRRLPDTRENAFYWRERRREGRKGEPWRGLLNAVLLLAMIFVVAFLGLWFLIRFGIVPDRRVPGWLGGQDGGRAVFALVAGVHALIVYYTARHLSHGVLAGEARRGTLYQLMMTRVPAFEMLLHITVYPFQQALAAAAAGLPFYVLLMGFGSVGIQEVAVLYLLFVVLAFSVPIWRTAAFAEQSPEEVGAVVQEQQRSAGCAAFVLVVAGLPGSMVVGSILLGVHMVSPQFASRIPPEVWPALPALPLTFMWVVIRVLTAPYTWFGLPLPVWVWLIPLALLNRFCTLWFTSFYLRVAHPAQIPSLSDMPSLALFRARLRALAVVAMLGYLWHPLLETGLTRDVYWPASMAGPGLGYNLGGMFYLIGVPCFFAALDRARRYGLLPKERRRGVAESLRWIAGPLLPLGMTILIGAIGAPRAFFSQPALSALAMILPAFAACLLLAASLGPGSATTWQLVFMAPLAFCLIPLPPITALAALSPLAAVAAVDPALNAAVNTHGSFFHLPVAWAAGLVPFMGALSAQYLWRTGRMRRSGTTARVLTPRVASNGAARPDPAVVAAAVAPPPQPDLEFILDAPSAPPASRSTGGQVPQVYGAVPQIRDPKAAIHDSHAPPIIRPPVPAQQAPPRAIQPLPSPVTDWRWRPLSPLAAAVLRWLIRRTDNPVALYSARRVLPGTLGIDSLVLLIAPSALGLVLAYLAPWVFWIVPLIPYGTPFLFPSTALFQSAQLQDDHALGLAMLITGMVLLTVLTPTRVCVNVANGFRMERERATLGFLLATPLSSLGVAVGHCVGAVLPALALWAGIAAFAVIPTILLGLEGYWAVAPWAWVFGFATSLMYLAMCAVTGAWIGITEEKARDMTIGVHLLPAAICMLGFGSALWLWLNRDWSYYACAGTFMGISLVLLAALWRNTLKELHRLRHGDVRFEGRAVGA